MLRFLIPTRIRPLICRDTKYINGGTKLQYFSQFKERLVQKFPEHELFDPKRIKNADWYKDLYNSVRKGCARSFLESADIFNSRCIPFYPKIQPEFVAQKERDRILHGDSDYAEDMQGLALKQLSKCLDAKHTGLASDTAGPLQERLWLVVLMLAVGRAGEIKFLRFHEMHWDNHLRLLDMTWWEPKTLSFHPMLFGPSNFDYTLDIYHAFGCFFMSERGLYRKPDLDPTITDFLFPCLHSQNNASVAGRVTKIIKEAVHPSMREQASSRSIRKGATTWLQHYPGIEDVHLNTRGGWLDTTNSKSYRETTPILTSPGDVALNRWKDTKTVKPPPSLRAINEKYHPKIDDLLRQLYMISDCMTHMKPDGKLRPFLEACTASLIMYHFDLVKDFKIRRHPVAADLLRGIQAVMRLDESDAIVILREWSTDIRDDFTGKNPDLSDTSGCHMREIIQQQSDHIRTLMGQNTELQKRVKEQQVVTDQLKVQIESLVAEVRDTMQKAVSELSHVMLGKTNRQVTPTPPRPGSMFTDGKRKASDEEVSDDTESVQAPMPKKLKKSSNVVVKLEGAKVTLANLLEKEYARTDGIRVERPNLKSITFNDLSDSDKIRDAFELIEVVLTDDQWDKLTTPGMTNSSDLADLCSTIETNCMEKIRELALEFGTETPSAGPAKKLKFQPNYMGISNRVKAVKKKAAEKKGLPKGAKNVPFRELIGSTLQSSLKASFAKWKIL